MFTTATRIIASARSCSVGAPVGVWFCTGNGIAVEVGERRLASARLRRWPDR
jgi:hypothetical protein